jgi:hypothetical protein
MEFRPSVGMKLFSTVFMLAGVIIIIATSVFSEIREPQDFFPIGLGVVFWMAGAFMFHHSCTPIVFDLSRGYFYKGRKKPEQMVDPSKLKHYASLKRVHALQIISEFCKSKNSSYYSYELNLVLDDGTRINVIDHGNQQAVRDDAQKLSGFLNKPLWDAS